MQHRPMLQKNIDSIQRTVLPRGLLEPVRKAEIWSISQDIEENTSWYFNKYQDVEYLSTTKANFDLGWIYHFVETGSVCNCLNVCEDPQAYSALFFNTDTKMSKLEHDTQNEAPPSSFRYHKHVRAHCVPSCSVKTHGPDQSLQAHKQG